MSEELRKAVDRVRELSPKLNHVTDDANKVVILVEKFLNDECSLGIPYYVVCFVWDKTDEYGNEIPRTSLGYDRVGGKFRIVVKDFTPADPGDGYSTDRTDTIPWSDCSRADKLSTFPHLPELLEGLTKEVESVIESAVTTGAAVVELLEAMAPGKADQPAKRGNRGR